MIILDYRIKFIFIFYIYIFSCVKIRVNPVLTRPLKDRVRVIGCATHLGRPVFWPEPIWPEPTWVKPEPDWPDPFARSRRESKIYWHMYYSLLSHMWTPHVDPKHKTHIYMCERCSSVWVYKIISSISWLKFICYF